MSTPSPTRAPRPSPGSSWLPGPRALAMVLLAMAAGLVAFLVIWSGGRKDFEFYEAGDTPPTSASRDYKPLPVPMSGVADSGLELGRRDDAAPGADDNVARVLEAPPPAMPPMVEPAAEPAPAPTATTTQPRPVRMPAPEYPARALRRGESGTVMLRVDVGADGRPTDVSIATSSRSRQLDRAAIAAVRRWEFAPAMRDGQPVAGTVRVPIAFTPGG